MERLRGHGHPPFPSHVVCPLRGIIMHAFELRDVYNPPQPSLVVRLELISAQYAHCLIDALEDTLLAFPMGGRIVHFTVSDMGPLRETLPDYTHTVDRHFYLEMGPQLPYGQTLRLHTFYSTPGRPHGYNSHRFPKLPPVVSNTF
jgi:hypothetical protein